MCSGTRLTLLAGGGG